ncbi:GNAT family N-acetyltransferase [Marininema halotolerans]|uniref:Protein N-acetyltransferase, RimJ/RimL family n=1 Tax=Marininema halotolerans TaxID=1155944 RepID=A0A1I6P670_9BACL|nr:GNAT family protein [Marininema halotolerans]SFS35590.1 Protein N-acetyltransferase, RimJ/RimL family [Marininema halotolerans]
MVTTQYQPFQKVQQWEQDGHVLLIRPACGEDAEELYNQLAHVVGEGIYLNETPESLPNINQQREEILSIQRDGGMYTVVLVDQQIVGAAILRRGLRGTSDHIVKFRTWLTSQVRGFGLGKNLLEYSVTWAESHPAIRKINLDVWANNERAVQLYEKTGFKVEGRRPQQAWLNGEYVDELYMGKFVS